MRGAAGDVRSVGTAAAGTTATARTLSTATRTAGTSMLLLGRAAKLGLAATAVATGVAAKEGWAYNKVIDSQRVGFETLLGSERKAALFMAKIQALALRSPILDPKSTGESARMLMAYGVSIRQVLPLVQAIGDMSAASGRSVEETMPRAAMAIGQIASKGKLQAEELNQLAESVGLSRDRIRVALKMTRAEFNDAFTPGNSISASKALPAVLEAMRAQSAGAADRLARTTQGKFAMLREVFSRQFGAITRPLYDLAGDMAGDLARSLKRLDVKGAMKDAGLMGREFLGGFKQGAHGGPQAMLTGIAAAGQRAGAMFRSIKSAVKDAGRMFMETFAPAAPFLENVLLPLLGGLAKGVLGSVVLAFKVLQPIVALFMRALGAIGTAARPLRPLFSGIGMVLGFVFAGPILKLLGAIPRLGFVFRMAAIPVRLLGGAVKLVGGFLLRVFAPAIGRGFWMLNRFAGIVGNVTRTVVRAFGSWLGAIRGALGRVFGFLGGLPGRFVRVGKSIVGGIARGIAGAPGALLNALKGVLKSAISHLPGPLASAASALIPGMAAGGRALRGGPYVVGEQGPEIVNLRRGDQVTPNARLGAIPPPLGGAGALLRIEVVSKLDGRQVGRGMATVAANDLAGP
jgi:tape measure domain-containing protein